MFHNTHEICFIQTLKCFTEYYFIVLKIVALKLLIIDSII